MELVELTDFFRRASLGNEYHLLREEYPNWSNDLHAKGNYIDNSVLEIISVNGLIRWYFEKISPFDIDYNFNHLIQYIDKPRIITFYDFKIIQALGNFLNIKDNDINQIDIKDYKDKYNFLNKKYKYTRHVKCKLFEKYCLLPFGHYICDIVTEEKFKMYLIEINEKYLVNSEYFSHSSSFNTFLEKYKKIIKWGIIYHKFKIVLEKISRVKHKDIYTLDIFVDKVQQYIYTLIVKYFDNMMINKPEYIHLSGEENLNNEIYFKTYSDDNLNIEFNFKI